jgi:hypothetical protein
MIKFDENIECQYCSQKPTAYVWVLRRWLCEGCYKDFYRFVYGDLPQNEENQTEEER